MKHYRSRPVAYVTASHWWASSTDEWYLRYDELVDESVGGWGPCLSPLLGTLRLQEILSWRFYWWKKLKISPRCKLKSRVQHVDHSLVKNESSIKPLCIWPHASNMHQTMDKLDMPWHMPWSHQNLRPVSVVNFLGIMLRNRWWPTTFHTILAWDADGWCPNWRVWSAPQSHVPAIALVHLVLCPKLTNYGVHLRITWL